MSGSLESQAFGNEMFDTHETGLYTQELHILDQVVEDLDRFVILKLLNIPLIDRLAVHIQ